MTREETKAVARANGPFVITSHLYGTTVQTWRVGDPDRGPIKSAVGTETDVSYLDGETPILRCKEVMEFPEAIRRLRQAHRLAMRRVADMIMEGTI